MLDELYSIETPEQVDVAYDVAGVGSRVLAALIDHLLIGLVILVVVLLVVAVSSLLDSASGLMLALVLAASSYLLLCGYHILFETLWNGQTPGKRMLGLRMVDISGRPIGFTTSAIRNLLRIVDFLPSAYAIGFVTMFFDKRARRLGDMAAGCMAVRQRDVVTLDSLHMPRTNQQPVVAAAQQVTIPNLRALRRNDIDLVQEFLRRRRGLAPDVRQRLASQLVGGLQQRLGYPVQGNPEDFLALVAAEYQALEAERAQ
jgi:uncharacterized RDD family membrane protein YckC